MSKNKKKKIILNSMMPFFSETHHIWMGKREEGRGGGKRNQSNLIVTINGKHVAINHEKFKHTRKKKVKKGQKGSKRNLCHFDSQYVYHYI